MPPAPPSRRQGPLLVALIGLMLGFALGWQAREFAAANACSKVGGVWMERSGFCGVADEAP